MNAVGSNAVVSHYYIASVKHTADHHEHITWWGKDHRGYTLVVGEHTGRYTLDEARRLNDGLDCIAVPLEAVRQLLSPEPYFRPHNPVRFYDQRGPVVDNTRANWNRLVAASLAEGRVQVPKPVVYRGKRRAFAMKQGMLAEQDGADFYADGKLVARVDAPFLKRANAALPGDHWYSLEAAREARAEFLAWNPGYRFAERESEAPERKLVAEIVVLSEYGQEGGAFLTYRLYSDGHVDEPAFTGLEVADGPSTGTAVLLTTWTPTYRQASMRFSPQEWALRNTQGRGFVGEILHPAVPARLMAPGQEREVEHASSEFDALPALCSMTLPQLLRANAASRGFNDLALGRAERAAHDAAAEVRPDMDRFADLLKLHLGIAASTGIDQVLGELTEERWADFCVRISVLQRAGLQHERACFVAAPAAYERERVTA